MSNSDSTINLNFDFGPESINPDVPEGLHLVIIRGAKIVDSFGVPCLQLRTGVQGCPSRFITKFMPSKHGSVEGVPTREALESFCRKLAVLATALDIPVSAEDMLGAMSQIQDGITTRLANGDHLVIMGQGQSNLVEKENKETGEPYSLHFLNVRRIVLDADAKAKVRKAIKELQEQDPEGNDGEGQSED